MNSSIVIIEDNTTGASGITVAALLEAGFGAVSFADPMSALAGLADLEPDIVILGGSDAAG